MTPGRTRLGLPSLLCILVVVPLAVSACATGATDDVEGGLGGADATIPPSVDARGNEASKPSVEGGIKLPDASAVDSTTVDVGTSGQDTGTTPSEGGADAIDATTDALRDALPDVARTDAQPDAKPDAGTDSGTSSCGPGTVYCAATGSCAACCTTSDCPAHSLCNQGTCSECVAGYGTCVTVCDTDLTSNSNCGSCGASCSTNSISCFFGFGGCGCEGSGAATNYSCQ